jgi:diadenosine tetraphosphate (Ap4A) HIT family hydrolase
LTDCTEQERDELFRVLKRLRDAANALFQPDRINYAFLGNIEPHLHGHFIPRYKHPRSFAGTTFTDARFGSNYDTDPAVITPDNVLLAITNAYQSFLSR